MNQNIDPSTDALKRAQDEAKAAHMRVDRQLAVVGRTGENALQNAWSSAQIAAITAAMIGGALATAAVIVAVRHRRRVVFKPVTRIQQPQTRPLLRAIGRALVAGIARVALQKVATAVQQRQSGERAH